MTMPDYTGKSQITVRTLIKLLLSRDMDAIVWMEGDGCYYPASDVCIDDDGDLLIKACDLK